jgi:lysophospholipase L1-like esterase
MPVTLSAQERWFNDIAAFRRTDAVQTPAKGGILFVGSSTFALWRDYAGYFPDYTIINRGFGGSSLRDVLYFYEDLVKPYVPKQIVLYEGDNDLTNENYSVEQFMDDVQCFVRLTQICYPDCDICLVSIKPSPVRRAIYPKYVEANRRMQAFCEQRDDALHFIDVWSLMVDEQGDPKGAENYFLNDHLHLNAAGYRLLANTITPYLLRDRVVP